MVSYYIHRKRKTQMLADKKKSKSNSKPVEKHDEKDLLKPITSGQKITKGNSRKR